MTEQIKRMEEEAKRQLLHYQENSASQIVKNIIKKAAGRYVAPKDLIFWPTGLLANTLMEHYGKWEDKEAVLTALTTYYDRWIDRGMPVFYMDDILCGVALIDLYKLTGREKYKAGADKLADFLYCMEETEADRAGSLPYRPSQKNHFIFADGIGMICPFLCKYGMEFGEERAIQIAVKQIRNMLYYGMDAKLMLPYHGYRYESGVKYGIIGWGRAVGWLLMGMSGTLRFLPAEREEYKELEEMYSKVVESTASYQKENGAFSWQLEAAEGPEDSSATAMIVQAVAEGLKFGILKGNTETERYGHLVRRAADYIESCEKDGKVFHCSGECMGFSEYPQIYGAYPWSLGPGLNLLMAAENLDK